MTPLQTVQNFIATWNQPDTFSSVETLQDYFTQDCVYENIGLSKTVGPEEALAFFAGFAKQLPFAGIKVDMLATAAQGDVVMTERIDYLVDTDGNILVKIPLMGIFKVRNGRIYEWRDYFDTAPLLAAAAQ